MGHSMIKKHKKNIVTFVPGTYFF